MTKPNFKPLDMDQCARRYPRLIRAMQWAAILSDYEASATLRDVRYASAGIYSANYLDNGGGEAVHHFGGPRAVIKAAWRCRHITRISMPRLRDLAKRCAWTWSPGGSAQWVYKVYDADGQLIGETQHHEWASWHRALAQVGRTEAAYSYPDMKTGITQHYA